MKKIVVLSLFFLFPILSCVSSGALYERWTQNNRTDHPAAYEAAKEYVTRFPNEQQAQQLKAWVAAYEKVMDQMMIGIWMGEWVTKFDRGDIGTGHLTFTLSQKVGPLTYAGTFVNDVTRKPPPGRKFLSDMSTTQSWRDNTNIIVRLRGAKVEFEWISGTAGPAGIQLEKPGLWFKDMEFRLEGNTISASQRINASATIGDGAGMTPGLAEALFRKQ